MEILACTVKVSLKYNQVPIFWTESSFTGRAYIGKVLVQVWLQSNKK